MEVLLANEFGFCFGVERAVEMVEDALEVGAPEPKYGPAWITWKPFYR